MANKLNMTTRAFRAPKITKPRTLFEFPIISNKTSLKQGVLTPIYVREVYPGDTWKGSHSVFLRSDISSKVPLDDNYLDVYYFYLPYRIIYPDFYKIFGNDDEYDNKVYTVPQLTLKAVDTTEAAEKAAFADSFLDQLVYRLRYSQVGPFQKQDIVSALPVWAYYDIFNYYFRDENLQPTIPYRDISTQFANPVTPGVADDWSTVMSYSDGVLTANYMLDNYDALGLYRANRKPDFMSVGMRTPQKGPSVILPIGTSAPVTISGNGALIYDFYNGNDWTSTRGQLKVTDPTSDVTIDASPSIVSGDYNLRYNAGLKGTANLANASTLTVNAFRLCLMTQSLYELRGTVGTRPQEQLKQWGVEATSSELDMPEYLGGESLALSNIPVLNTTTSDLGDMSGVGATFAGTDNNRWSKTCPEMGVIIGLAVIRTKHSYPQGMDTRIWDLENDLDFYHWLFAHQGHVGKKNKLIFNNPGDSHNDEVFNYSPAYDELRTDWSFLSGIFSHMSGDDYIDFRTKWSYADYYDSLPTFSPEWLREPVENVARTLTGRLIPNAANTLKGNQFMLEFKFGMSAARVLPAYSVPANLTGRW